MLGPLINSEALDDEPSMTTCAVVWCDRDAIARGQCGRCYGRYRRGIIPNAPNRGHAVAKNKEWMRGEVTERREVGQSIADIAAAVWVGTSTARKWLRKWGVRSGTVPRRVL
ncbi:hypothetical protein ACU4IU_16930 [Brevibacterium sp. CSND-B09]|uniref:hypothetical protein n=1 Tax=Brevibacterium sp. CSND-B09 TaxID=3462571 RepID=UPI00406A2B1C